jgi:hypothetical protein
MSKFSEMQKQLEQVGKGKPVASKPVLVNVSAAPAADVPEAPAKPYKAPSREGKIHIGAYLHPDFKRSLRLVQAQTEEDVQQLLSRALNDLFRAHNVPVIDQD